MKLKIRSILIALYIASALMNLCGCSEQKTEPKGRHHGNPVTASWITKNNVLSGPVAMESTPVIWNNRLTLVTWEPAATPKLVVWDLETMTRISELAWGLGFPSTIVDNGSLYVFGTQWGSSTDMGGVKVEMVSTTDLSSWTAPVTLFTQITPIGQTIYNTSVTHDQGGGFIMAYEVCENEMTCFGVRFKRSNDLVTWTDVGALMQGPPGKGYYTGCPTIRFVNGYYYLFTLADFGMEYSTLISRSADLVTWEESSQAVISPDGPDHNKNTSDFDLVEFNGQVEMVYSKSYQESESNVDGIGIRRAHFEGSLAQFVERFF